MKVLYVTHYSGFLGANRSLLQVVRILKKYGVIPLVVVPCEGEFTQYLKDEDIPYTIMPTYYCLYVHDSSWIKNLYYRIKGCFGEFLNVVISCYYSYFVLKKEKLNIVHSNSSATNIGAYIALFLHVKHVWHVREFLRLHYNICFPWSIYLQRTIMRNMADVIIPISKSVKQYFSTFIDKSMLTLIYNGVEYKPVKHTASETPINIVMVGLIHPSKRQSVVVQALKKMIDRGFSCLHLYIVGNIDPVHAAYYEMMNKYIKDRGLESYVSFTGYIKDVTKILSQMHIGILASENEAFGRVTVEYMLSGLIPIVANSGGSVEIVTNGVDGYIFNDEEDLVNILETIITNKATRERISMNAYKTAVTRFSSEENALNIYNCYKKVLQS